MKKIQLFLLLFVSVLAIAGCATEDWNTGSSTSSSGYPGGHHH
ncbi:MAG: hypothetical protein V1840_05090 [Candidatus Omnitrophota bacterium]